MYDLMWKKIDIYLSIKNLHPEPTKAKLET